MGANIKRRIGNSLSRIKEKKKDKEIEEAVKHLVESNGYKFISKDFRSTLTILCQQGHKIITKTSDFKSWDFECEECRKKKKLKKSLKLR